MLLSKGSCPLTSTCIGTRSCAAILDYNSRSSAAFLIGEPAFHWFLQHRLLGDAKSHPVVQIYPRNQRFMHLPSTAATREASLCTAILQVQRVFMQDTGEAFFRMPATSLPFPLD
jgi:hypothetical protein